MRAYLARHGKAKSAMDDPSRGLSLVGAGELEKVARLLSADPPPVSAILHSGKTRARETAEILARSFRTEAVLRPVADLKPEADPEEMVQFLNAASDNILAVGHLPSIERIVSLLLTRNRDHHPIQFNPGTLVCLERHGDDEWTLVWAIIPDLL